MRVGEKFFGDHPEEFRLSSFLLRRLDLSDAAASVTNFFEILARVLRKFQQESQNVWRSNR